MKKKLSWILYLVGFIGAAIIGLLEGLERMPEMAWIPITLVAIGLVIGFVNISNKEAVAVMIAALVLGASTGILALLPGIGGVLEAIFMRIAFLSIPIAIPVGVKTLLMKGQ